MEANCDNSQLDSRLRRRQYLRRRHAAVRSLQATPTTVAAISTATSEGGSIDQSNSSETVTLDYATTTTPPISNISRQDECNINTTDITNLNQSAPDDEESTSARMPAQDQDSELETVVDTSEAVATALTSQTSKSLSDTTTNTTPRIFPTIQPAVDLINPSVNAVRVLFRDQQQQVSRRALNSGNSPTTTGSQSARTIAPIVSANRRLIERQIEAIQEADSRRWNFDFVNCRPLGQSGHRYVHHFSESPRNCRPLNDQNQANTTTLFNSQQQWSSPTHQGGELQRHSDHKQDDG